MRVRLFAAILGMSVLLVGPARADTFRLTSPDIADGQTIPQAHVFNGFGCSGSNASPALAWSGAPKGTLSFVVTAYDPDAPTGSGWWHWVVFNLPASTDHLERGAGTMQGEKLPARAVQARTDFGAPGYGGPCPPVGDEPHRYVFTVHALKTETLPLDAEASGAMVGFFVSANSLGTASLTATYGR